MLGTKKLPKNKWSKTVIKNKKHFLGKNKKDIKNSMSQAKEKVRNFRDNIKKRKIIKIKRD